MEPNNANNRISFEELIERLKTWLQVTNDSTLGIGYGNSPYWHFTYNKQNFVINSDTRRDAVRTFISKHDNGDFINIIPPNRGRRKKMTYGEESIKGLYIYED